MPHPKLVVLVRFRSSLSHEEAMKVAKERGPEFRALGGLLQKYYLQDPVTGEYCGMYMWRSKEDFDEYRTSELRASIAKAYQVEGEPQVQVLRMLMPLREDVP